MGHQIVLYDMTTKVGAWSVNTWRTRCVSLSSNVLLF